MPDTSKKKPAPYMWTQDDGKIIHFEFDDGTGFSMYEDQALLMARTIHDLMEDNDGDV